MKRFAILCVITCFSSGCASITGSSNQPVSVTSIYQGQTINGATCNLVNDKGQWYLTTPGSVVIHKAYGDLLVNCKKEDQLIGTGIFKSTSDGAVFGNIIAGGLIGYAVDASSGAGFSYPPTMTVELNKLDSK